MPATSKLDAATSDIYEALSGAALDADRVTGISEQVDRTDYFSLLGFSAAYAIDLSVLQERYRSLSRRIHPDRLAALGETAAAAALRISARVNEAYSVLADPYRRAEYLLELSGGPSAAQDKRVPPDLLGKVMMLREEIDEAKESGDAATLNSMREEMLRQQEREEEQLKRSCAALTAADADAQAAVRLSLNTLKYYHNLLAQL